MRLRDLPFELLCRCVDGSDGSVRKTCKALRDAFDELAGLEGVDLPLVGWRNVGPYPGDFGRSGRPVHAALRVRPTAGKYEYDLEITRLECPGTLDPAKVGRAVGSGATRSKRHSKRFDQFQHRSTREALAAYSLVDCPAVCVERMGVYVRLVARHCSADRRHGCRYFTVVYAADVADEGDEPPKSMEAYARLGWRIVDAKRFCDQLVRWRRASAAISRVTV